ncbi:MAG: protein translocase subunit SecF [Candidatus Omnitrophota bacterium]
MRIFKDVPNIKFMKIRKVGFIVSSVIVLVGIILFFTRGFNMAIEFTGGTSLDVSMKNKINISDVRNALDKVGLGKSVIQQVSTDTGSRFIIKASLEQRNNAKQTDEANETERVSKLIESALISNEEKNQNASKVDLNNAPESDITNLLISKGVPRETAEETSKAIAKCRKDSRNGLINTQSEIDGLNLKKQPLTVLKDNAYLGSFTFLSVESIGPQVGKDMRQRATLATILSLIGMLIYIALRFRILYGVSGVLTLVHDTAVVLTFIMLFRIEFSLSVLAAILTLIGYSINDTIVIFDRLRDNLSFMKKDNLEVIMDASINQTLSRTVITAGTVFLTVIALFFFGGEVIHAFSATLLVGVIVGTYSSIYQSCAWLMVWEKKFMQMLKKK